MSWHQGFTDSGWGMVLIEQGKSKTVLFITRTDENNVLPSEEDARVLGAARDLLKASKLALAYLQKAKYADGDAYPALIKAIQRAEGK